VAYAQGAPGTPEASEATFWHGVFLLAPTNTGGSVHEATKAFDDYLGTGSAVHREEALALQRTTHVIDSLAKTQRSLDSLPTVHIVVSDDSSKSSAREQEMAKTVKQLQDSLNKTTAELERIKKRLSTGKP
jgi:vacuolar-type H+-ATPase subunit I/STV1